MIPNLTSRCLAILKAWGPAAFWMILIFSASADSQSVAHTSRIIGPFCRWIYPNVSQEQVETVQFIVRKGAHMSEYALLSVLLLYALSTNRGDPRRWISSAWVLSAAYAAADEFHQLFVPGRNPAVLDVLIDSTGAALGLVACHGVLRWRESKKPMAGGGASAAQVAPVSPVQAPEPLQRPTFADQLLCTLHGEDFENRTQIRFAVQDRLQRDNGGRLILGRNPAAAQLCVKNTSVSGQHLALILRRGQFEIEDLDSSNGTRLNGRRLTPFQPAVLADNDRIEAGEVLLHFRRMS